MLINKKALRTFILKKWMSKFPHWKINCVASSTYDIYEAVLKNTIIKDMDRHNSKGKTFDVGGMH